MSSFIAEEQSSSLLNTSGYLTTNPLVLARAAREHIRTVGRVPLGFLREEIEQSWRRSLRAGVECYSSRISLDSAVDDIRGLLNQHEDLLQCALADIDSLHSHLGANTVILLADAEARILAVRGDLQTREFDFQAAIRPGMCWQESLLGTNALGTALQDRRPLQILPGEHYLEKLAAFSCCSAPIMDAHGQLVGVLDITGYGQRGTRQDTLSLASFAVRNIESRLFFQHYRHHCVLAFHSARHYLRSSWQGLIAFDDHGRIAAVNATGCQLLQREADSLSGLLLEQVLDVSLDRLLQEASQADIQQRRTPAGKLYFAFAHMGQARRPTHSQGFPSTSSSAATVRTAPVAAAESDRNPGLQRSLNMARRALDHQIPVLILGETGTGKEVAARHLHQASQRQQQPFVALNCAAIPASLIESELFGYHEGAFTGSRKGGMKGRLEQANGGTLFLDEIGDMPLDMQARLLRVLQERRIQPLGAAAEIELDVQVIGATHRNLRQMVADGQFREDLYYRLNGISVTLPALRERADFAELVDQLIQRYGHEGIRIDRQLLQQLRQWHWPGNVRQLEMIIKVAVAFMDNHEQVLGEDHLPPDFLQELQAPTVPSGLLHDNETSLIRQALERHSGNVSAAATALGISRATLYRKLRDMPDVRA